MEVAAAVATHDFQLAVDGFNDVGGREGFSDRVGILQERQIVLALLAEVCDPRGIELGEAITKILELTVADLDVPRGLDGAPALLKLRAVGLRQMGFGVALHVDGAELNIGLGKEALADRQQAGEVVLDEDHDATEVAFNQTAKNGFPVFKIFTTGPGNTGKDGFLTIAAEADHQVDAGRAELIAVSQFDVVPCKNTNRAKNRLRPDCVSERLL